MDRSANVNPDNAENPISELSYPDFQEWQSARRTFEQIAATDERPVDISGDQRSASVAAAAYVSWNTFSLVSHVEMGATSPQLTIERCTTSS